MNCPLLQTGAVNLDCDVSLEAFDLEIDGTFELIVKFGPEFNDDSDEILIIPHEAYQIDVSQFIYELIILSMPSKRVHPKSIGWKHGIRSSKKTQRATSRQ